MLDRHQWIEARKKTLQGIKDQVRVLLGPEEPSITDYARSYKETFLDRWDHSSRRDLSIAIHRSKIVLGGDFHAFAQAQRVHLRVLREYEGELTLALECFESKDQKYIDQFLDGSLQEDEFLHKISWQERWIFPWSHYRPLLMLALEKKFQVVGINKYFARASGGNLYKRDQHAYGVIEKLFQENRDRIIYVIIGDLHLGYDHLPVLLEMGLGLSSKELLLLYQNAETLYFQLADQNVEHKVEILKASGNRFCVMGAPPWVKWQSYLMYLEQTYDRDIAEEEGIDYTEYMVSLIEFAGLDLKLSFSASEDVQVFDSGHELFWEHLSNDLAVNDLKVARYHIQTDRSFFLPKDSMFYLSRYSLNHSSDLAGQYIHAKLSRRKFNLWNFPDDFLKWIWVQAVGFFFSKLVNHKRKAESLAQIKRQLSAMNPQDFGREALQLVLEQRFCEFIFIYSGKKRPRIQQPLEFSSYIIAGKILGQLMGERLFLAFNQGRVDRDKLIEYLTRPLDGSSKDFERFYYNLAKRFESSTQINLEGYNL